MSIRQFNAAYVAAEDRILLRVTLEDLAELRLWLTRATLRSLFRQVDAWQAPTGASPVAAVEAFRRQAGLARADFSTPHEPGGSFPLGETPLLVESIRMAAGDDEIHLVMELAGHQQADFTITGDVLLGLDHLLRHAVQAADWGLASGAEAVVPVGGRLH